jgi:hypothetical protein
MSDLPRDRSIPGVSWLARAAAVALAASLGACYPDGPTSVTELDVVSTFYDQERDFGVQRTYAMPDSVHHARDEENPDNNVELSREFDDFILERVEANMSALGYQRISIDQQPDSADVAILVTALGVRSFVISPGYPPYWGWWPDWGWGGGWGDWYYPWVPPRVSSYTTGTLFIDMAVPDSTNVTEDDLIIVWEAVANGLVGTGTQTTRERLRTGIDQAFAQSPYLGVGQ